MVNEWATIFETRTVMKLLKNMHAFIVRVHVKMSIVRKNGIIVWE